MSKPKPPKGNCACEGDPRSTVCPCKSIETHFAEFADE